MTTSTLSNPGDRNERMTVELATSLIASWETQLATGVTIDTLDLSCRVYPLEVATVLCNFLKDHVAAVKHAILNDIIASLVTEEGLAVLKQFNDLLKDSPLETLNLSDNALGIRGIELFPDLLSKTTLQSFSMENDGISAESMVFLRETLATASLKELYIYNNMIGVEGACETGKILSSCRKIEAFRYEGCRPQPEGTSGLLAGLDEMSKETQPPVLKSLFLEGSLSDTPSRKTLCRVLARAAPSLTNLRLYDCSLERSGCKLVLNTLKSHTNLAELNVAQNELGHGRAMDALLPLLRGNKLTMLNLNANEITSEGVEKMCEALKEVEGSIALEELYLRENQLGPRAATALVAIAGRLEKLRIIDLAENGFTDDSVSALEEAFGDRLQELEDNDDEGEFDDDIEEEDDDDDDEDEEDGDDDVDALAGALSQTTI